MLSQILGALSLLKEIISGIKEVFAFFEKAKEDAWYKDLAETRTLLKNAKTSEERKEVAKKIRDIFGGF